VGLPVSSWLSGSISVAAAPQDNPDWKLVINGAVNNPLSLSLNDLATMPRSETTGSIYCDGDLVSAGNWGGVQISYLLNQANVDPTATDLEFHAADGYKINIQVEAAIQQNMIIAYKLDSQPLNEVLRLALPGYPGNYWISTITEITVTKSTDYNIATNYYQMQVSGSTQTTPLPNPTATPKSTPIPTASPTQQPTPSTKPTQTPDSTTTATPTTEGTLNPQPETTSAPQVTQTPNPPTDSFPAEYIYTIVVIVLIAVIALGAIRFAKHGKTKQ
jgi:hypothetical protein